MFIFHAQCTLALYCTVHRYKPLLTLCSVPESFQCTQPLLPSTVTPASHWSSGPIQPSDWLTPQTDTRARVGPNNCSLHNTVQSTQHLPCTHLNSSSRENYEDISENIVTSDMGMWHYMWWGRGRRKKFPQTFSENFLDVRPSVTLCDDNVRSHYTRCYGYFSPRYRSLSPNIRHPPSIYPSHPTNSTVDIRSWEF